MLATPYVRGLIKERKLDINAIKGTGPNRRILEQDVLNFSSKPKETQKKEAPKKEETSSSSNQSRIIKMSNF